LRSDLNHKYSHILFFNGFKVRAFLPKPFTLAFGFAIKRQNIRNDHTQKCGQKMTYLMRRKGNDNANV